MDDYEATIRIKEISENELIIFEELESILSYIDDNLPNKKYHISVKRNGIEYI